MRRQRRTNGVSQYVGDSPIGPLHRQNHLLKRHTTSVRQGDRPIAVAGRCRCARDPRRLS
jgi:hypothetical protein